MKVIRLDYPHSYMSNNFPELVMALGFFDGVHLGHQKVIKEAKKIAELHQQKTAVMTFNPHPSVVLGKGKEEINYITPLEEKIKLMNELHVDYLFIVHFTKEFSQLLPEEFVRTYLIDLNVKHAVAGFDFTYGKFGKGNMDTLPIHSEGYFEVTVIPKLEKDQQKISSTAIRGLIKAGNIIEVNRFLGRQFKTIGTVVHGEKRGRMIGFPTANLQMDSSCLLPKTGVYAVKACVQEKWHLGVCNVGYKPTFHDPSESQLSVEVYLVDFDQSIYGETVTLAWYRRIRDEQKFSGLEELIAQIKNDTETTIEYFSSLGKET